MTMNRTPSSVGPRWLTLVLFALLWSCSNEPTGVGDPSLQAPEAALIEPTGPNSVRLSWANAESRATAYRVERRANLEGDFQLVSELPASEDSLTAFLDIGLEAETFYGYRVRTVGRLGAISVPSVVFGVLTPPLPAIEVATIINAPNAASADLDGYVIRITGPESVTLQIGSVDRKRSIPLAPGTYTARIEGVRESCEVVGPSEVTVEVTDVGVNTIAAITFSVVCRDPTRGEVVIEVRARGDVPSGTEFGVGLTGVVSDSTDVDETRSLNAAAQVSTRFSNLLPGVYQAALRDYDTETCRLDGSDVSDEIDVGPLSADTIRFELDCTEVVVQNPNAPFVWQSTWAPDTVAPGSAAVLAVGIDATARPATALTAIGGLIRWDDEVVQLDSAAGVGSFSSIFVANPGVGEVDFNAVSTSGATGFVDFGRFYFTVVGAAGSTVRSRTSREPGRLIVADLDENEISLDSIRVVEDTLTIGTGGGGPVPLTAEAGGPYSGVVGQAVAFNGSGSTGAVVRYLWDFGDGTPVDSSGAGPMHTYGTAGSYTAVLTVRDSTGSSVADSSTVSIIEPTTGSGNVRGRWVDASGAPITQADVGDAVRFQLCATEPSVSSFQAVIRGFSALATNTGSSDLVSSGPAVHPDCVGTVDNLDAFFTSSGTTEPITALIATTAGAGSGTQGIFEFDFTIEAEGDLLIALDSIVASVGSGAPLVVETDIETLTIGSGGGGGGGGIPSGTAWHYAWSGSDPLIGDVVSLTVSTNPGKDLYWAVGDVLWNASVLDFDSASVDPYFSDLANVVDEGAGRVGIVARGPSSVPVPAGTTTTVAELFFTVANTGTVTTGVSDLTLWEPVLRSIDVSALQVVHDTLIVGSGQANERPIAVLDAPPVAVTDASVSFSAAESSDADGTIVSYAWTFGDGATGSGVAPQHTYTLDGSYPVRVTVTDDAGSVASDSVTITIVTTTPPVPDANGPYAGLAGSSIGFTASGSFDPDGVIVSFDWDFGDGSTGSGPAPTHSYASAGVFPVVLTVTDDNGVAVADTTSATVSTPVTFSMKTQWSAGSAARPLPGGPAAVQGPPGQAGPGDVVRLTVSTRPGLGLTGASTRLGWNDAVARLDSVQGHGGWDVDFTSTVTATDSVVLTGVRSTASASTDEVVLADLYYTVLGLDGSSSTTSVDRIVILDAAGDTADVASLPDVVSTLEVVEAGSPPPTADAGGPYTASVDSVVTFDATGSSANAAGGSIVRYDWTFGDGTTAADAGATPTHSYSAPGTYTVTVTVTDDGGLIASSSASVSIAFPPPSGNVVGRWVDGSGAPISEASVGDTVEFQLCSTIEDMNAFQAQFAFDSTAVVNTSSSDLDSSAAAVHPTCAGTNDILDSFFTASGTETPVGLQIVSLDAAAGTGMQGIFSLVFDVTEAGLVEIEVLAGVTYATISGTEPPLVFDLAALTVN